MSADCISLAHGEGGWLSRQLLEQTILPRLKNAALGPLNDSALLPAPPGRLAFTTDSFVVAPLFFPGGDIGRLAVFGTVNDLVVAGARPRWLSLSLIIEEGLELAVLERVLDSVASAAREVEVAIVTGDTKVVPRQAADQLFITTAGIGELLELAPPGPPALQPGDVLIVSGPLGQHGIAILSARECLGFAPAPLSDCRSLAPLASALRQAKLPIQAMRDATRGGVAAVLHEWATASGCTLAVDAARIPVSAEVRGAAELLGLDPIHIANEGVLVLASPADVATTVVEALRACRHGGSACTIGEVRLNAGSPVLIRRGLREQPLDFPSGALLPRIC